jgi:hypothetical protein
MPPLVRLASLSLSCSRDSKTSSNTYALAASFYNKNIAINS